MASDALNVLEELVASDAPSATVAGLLAELLDCWGGQKGVATCLHSDYEAARPGDPNRIRILTLIVSLLLKVGGEGDGEDSDLESLKRQALELMKKIEASADD